MSTFNKVKEVIIDKLGVEEEMIKTDLLLKIYIQAKKKKKEYKPTRKHYNVHLYG